MFELVLERTQSEFLEFGTVLKFQKYPNLMDSGARSPDCSSNYLSGLRRTATSSPSLIVKFLVSLLRVLVFISDGCSPSPKANDENKDVRDDYKNGNEGLKDPGRRGRRPGDL